jgi:hypothetical protein
MYSIVLNHAICMLFRYLNRVGSRIARPERLNYEIVSSNCLPSLFSLKAVSIVDIVRGARYNILVPNVVLEARESLTSRA